MQDLLNILLVPLVIAGGLASFSFAIYGFKGFTLSQHIARCKACQRVIAMRRQA